MSTVTTCPLRPDASGNVTKVGLLYTPTVGLRECKVRRDEGSGNESRCLMQFDTTTIPSDATIQDVELYIVFANSQPEGAPEVWNLEFYLGNFIGAELDGAAEWDGGTLVHQEAAPFPDMEYVELGSEDSDPESLVNAGGYTDLRIVDAGVRGTGDQTWGRDLNGPARGLYCLLRVTHTGGTAPDPAEQRIVTPAPEPRTCTPPACPRQVRVPACGTVVAPADDDRAVGVPAESRTITIEAEQ